MNILITGATGFIGSHLTKELCKQGYHCRCLVRNIDKAKEIFKDYKNIEFVIGDITKPETLKNIGNNIDVVFHLAAHGHVAATSEEAFKKFYKINVKGAENLLNECLNKNISKFFHFSSTAAVGLIPDIVVD
ncbi:MAG: SDR family NAD(P)-dependent oxidoreductase, partial [Candidatus Marinimicrobia bacterium]|nr:SDR family NAD(P)-dependent oxidoreductase [bacterium]MCG2716257.1 SDR family NAD(P)-dependent oxidoreductase [Candidatus Neomarinimicrobiota bacterium]